MPKLNKNHIEQAKKHFKRIKELVTQKPSPFEGMTKDEAIEEIRKVREKLWEKKFVTHT